MKITSIVILLCGLAMPVHAQTTPAQTQQILDLLHQVEALVSPPPTTPTPPAGKITTLAATANLQAALTSAACGDTLLLPPTATYAGSLTLNKACGPTPITVQSAGVLPPGRVAVDATLPKILPTAGEAFTVDIPGSGYVLRGLDIMGVLYGTVTIEGANDLVDQCRIHGNATGDFKRGVALNGTNDSVTRSRVTDFHATGQDSQAVGGWLGAGPYTIDNNDLEAASENILFGGNDPMVLNVVPSNITITNNYITKPLAWHTSTKWNVKNLIELKNAAHVVIAHNVLENVWQQAQGGYALVLTVRDQDGTAPWSTVQDVSFTENVVRHAGAGINVLGIDDDATRPSVRMARITILRNLFYDIDPKKWNDPGGAWAAGRLLMINGGPNGFEFGHNTMVYSTPNTSPTLNTALTLGQMGDVFKTAGLNVHDNVLAEGDYGVIGDTVGIGVIALQTYAPGYTFMDNLLVRGTSGGNYNYPPTTTVSPAGATVMSNGFVLAGTFATLPSTDGKPVGADIVGLLASIPGLDLTK